MEVAKTAAAAAAAATATSAAKMAKTTAAAAETAAATATAVPRETGNDDIDVIENDESTQNPFRSPTFGVKNRKIVNYRVGYSFRCETVTERL